MPSCSRTAAEVCRPSDWLKFPDCHFLCAKSNPNYAPAVYISSQVVWIDYNLYMLIQCILNWTTPIILTEIRVSIGSWLLGTWYIYTVHVNVCVSVRGRPGLSWDKRQESVVTSIWKGPLTTGVRASRISRSLEYKIYVLLLCAK